MPGRFNCCGGSGGGGDTENCCLAVSSLTNIDNGAVLASSNRYFVDSAGGSFGLSLPAAPTDGDVVVIHDVSGQSSINPITITGNAGDIDGNATFDISLGYGAWEFVWSSALTEWVMIAKTSGVLRNVELSGSGVFNLESNTRYFADTSGNSTFNLPATALTGDIVEIYDTAGDFADNIYTIDGNGNGIDGVSSITAANTYGNYKLIYSDLSGDWTLQSLPNTINILSVGFGDSPIAGNVNTRYFMDGSGGAIVLNLPATPSAGDTVFVHDITGDFVTNNVTVNGVAGNIEDTASKTLDIAWGVWTFIWDAVSGLWSMEEPASGGGGGTPVYDGRAVKYVSSSFTDLYQGSYTACEIFETVEFNDDGVLYTTTGTTLLTIAEAGRYEITHSLHWENISGDPVSISAAIRVNGASQSATSVGILTGLDDNFVAEQGLTQVLQLGVGSTIELMTVGSTGSPESAIMVLDDSSFIHIVRLKD